MLFPEREEGTDRLRVLRNFLTMEKHASGQKLLLTIWKQMFTWKELKACRVLGNALRQSTTSCFVYFSSCL